jgi:hypothetical protein
MESMDDVAVLMRANLPDGVTLREFGHDVMHWGTGSASAQDRMATLTLDELQAAGITAEMADNWATAYEIMARLMPRNPSANGRAELMRHAAMLLRGASS